MKLPRSAHTTQPWRIHEIAYDFQLLDVWALPTPGGPDDFPRLIEWVTALDPTETSSNVVNTLFEIRRKLGELFGWDPTDADEMRATVRDRLPADLAAHPPDVAFEVVPAAALYLTEDEFVAEIVNDTSHGLLHLGWVKEGDGYRGQLAVLVRPNGLLGKAYIAAISPFRHWIVYPTLTRAIGSYWNGLRLPRCGTPGSARRSP